MTKKDTQTSSMSRLASFKDKDQQVPKTNQPFSFKAQSQVNLQTHGFKNQLASNYNTGDSQKSTKQEQVIQGNNKFQKLAFLENATTRKINTAEKEAPIPKLNSSVLIGESSTINRFNPQSAKKTSLQLKRERNNMSKLLNSDQHKESSNNSLLFTKQKNVNQRTKKDLQNHQISAMVDLSDVNLSVSQNLSKMIRQQEDESLEESSSPMILSARQQTSLVHDREKDSRPKQRHHPANQDHQTQQPLPQKLKTTNKRSQPGQKAFNNNFSQKPVQRQKPPNQHQQQNSHQHQQQTMTKNKTYSYLKQKTTPILSQARKSTKVPADMIKVSKKLDQQEHKDQSQKSLGAGPSKGEGNDDPSMPQAKYNSNYDEIDDPFKKRFKQNFQPSYEPSVSWIKEERKTDSLNSSQVIQNKRVSRSPVKRIPIVEKPRQLSRNDANNHQSTVNQTQQQFIKTPEMTETVESDIDSEVPAEDDLQIKARLKDLYSEVRRQVNDKDQNGPQMIENTEDQDYMPQQEGIIDPQEEQLFLVQQQQQRQQHTIIQQHQRQPIVYDQHRYQLQDQNSHHQSSSNMSFVAQEPIMSNSPERRQVSHQQHKYAQISVHIPQQQQQQSQTNPQRQTPILVQTSQNPTILSRQMSPSSNYTQQSQPIAFAYVPQGQNQQVQAAYHASVPPQQSMIQIQPSQQAAAALYTTQISAQNPPQAHSQQPQSYYYQTQNYIQQPQGHPSGQAIAQQYIMVPVIQSQPSLQQVPSLSSAHQQSYYQQSNLQ